MPQEQFGGRTVPASDLYSLGATLVYLLTGTHPADLPQKDFRIQFEQATKLSPNLTHWLKLMIEPELEKRFASAIEALTVLKQPPSLETINLSIHKPAESKIEIIKNADRLEIIIPPTGFQSSMIVLGLSATAWNLFVFMWTISALSVPFPINIPFTLFSLPFWGAGLTMIYIILAGLFTNTVLTIDNQQIMFTQKWWKWNIKSPTSYPRTAINKLLYTPQHFTKDRDGSNIKLHGKLEIWAGEKKIQLDAHSMIIKTEEELEWLAKEISDWLNCDLTTFETVEYL